MSLIRLIVNLSLSIFSHPIHNLLIKLSKALCTHCLCKIIHAMKLLSAVVSGTVGLAATSCGTQTSGQGFSNKDDFVLSVYDPTEKECVCVLARGQCRKRQSISSSHSVRYIRNTNTAVWWWRHQILGATAPMRVPLALPDNKMATTHSNFPRHLLTTAAKKDIRKK